jgi:hypothetical protein
LLGVRADMLAASMKSLLKSPFPGMDPYLEARWPNVHTTLIAAIQEALQPALPAGLRARAEERVLLEGPADDLRRYRSDVAVIETNRNVGPLMTSPSFATVDPVFIEFHDATEVERWVQIIDTTAGNRIVTAIEVLSPGNKAPGHLNALYCRKLHDYQRGHVSVVEIDLLRRPSRHRLLIRSDDLPASRRTPYLVCVRKAWQPASWAAYPLALRDPLATIPVPLREDDAEVPLDLQRLVEHAYVAGGHDDIDYSVLPEPPLEGEDAAWAVQVIRARRT